ncbi:MAG: extradiol dioxygenase [Chitinophagaceae bacterium]|nr:extradiol dioxygenase [Chitinophagaceae bacterium]
MITGVHSLIYSTRPEKDRNFLLNILKLPNVDVGNGRLIFGLPPSEISIHSSTKNNIQEIYFMCEDINHFIKEMAKLKIMCSPIKDQGWGIISKLTLPGGGKISIYQPRHARPPQMKIKTSSKKKAVSKSKNSAIHKK